MKRAGASRDDDNLIEIREPSGFFAWVEEKDNAHALLRDLAAALGETLVSDLLEKVDQMAKNAPTFMQEKAAQGTAHTIRALTAKGGA